MEDRKRPFVAVDGLTEQQPMNKNPRFIAQDSNGPTQQTIFRRGRGRNRGQRNIPHTAIVTSSGISGRHQQGPRRARPSTTTDPNKLLTGVCCSSLWYEECRSALVDDFPDSLPTSFSDSEHYTSTFLPLLLEEARESIKSSFSDGCEQGCYWNVKVQNVETQGSGWVKIETIVQNFNNHGQAPRLFPNVSVVLTNMKPWKKHFLENLQQKVKSVPVQSKTVLFNGIITAVVTQQDAETGKLILRARPVCDKHQGMENSLCHKILETLKKFPDAWFMFPTGGLVTQQRECDILHSLDRIPVIEAILKPAEKLKMNIESVPRKLPMELGQGIQEFICQTYDASQADAILMCTAHFCKESTESVDDHGSKTLPILLIQGPPGTGKTHTVKGILNLWHLVQFERYYKKVIGQYRNLELCLGSGGRMKKSELATARTLMKPRILVCAPSNAAVDELLERIIAEGFRDSTGRVYKPNLVRVGAEDAPFSNEARLVLLDTLVNGYLNMTKLEWNLQRDRLQSKIQMLEREISTLEQILMEDEKNIDLYGGVLLSNMEKLDKTETEIYRLNLVESIVNEVCPNERSVREALELNFLDGAEMVFTTLSSTGKKVLSRVNRGFETVLIDEAAQASEVAALQPLVYGCQQCVLVGDPQQLPATILSQKGKDLNMERSLFARLQEGGAPVKLLKTQYRMHPWIRSFPSTFFYNNILEDGANINENEHESFYDHDLLKPYVVFDVPTGLHERQGGGSLQNQVEADLAAALFRELRDFLIQKQKKAEMENRMGPKPVKVGILTPYRSQTRCLTNTFAKTMGPEVASEVKIMTVDSCQGKQLDVVIFSCVRGSPKASSVGFVSDIRRMNVAITRAKKALWILGNFRTLVGHPAWAALAKDAKERECFVVESTAQSLFPHHEPQNPSDAASQHSTEAADAISQHSMEAADAISQYSTEAADDENSKMFDTMDPVDPRIGLIKGWDSEKDKKIEKEKIATQDIKTDNPIYLATQSSQVRQDHRGGEGTVKEQPVKSDETVSEQFPTSDAGVEGNSKRLKEEHERSEKWPIMVISAQRPSKIIGPSENTGEAVLIVDTDLGRISTPVSILYHGQEGFQPQFLLQGLPSSPNKVCKRSKQLKE